MRVRLPQRGQRLWENKFPRVSVALSPLTWSARTPADTNERVRGSAVTALPTPNEARFAPETSCFPHPQSDARQSDSPDKIVTVLFTVPAVAALRAVNIRGCISDVEKMHALRSCGNNALYTRGGGGSRSEILSAARRWIKTWFHLRDKTINLHNLGLYAPK